jgi:HAD superfamily hydrolase (TIGR01490 family)
MAKPIIHIFDLDRTITRLPTYSAFLLGTARKQAPWRLFLAPLLIPFLLGYLCKILSRKSLKQIMHRLMLGRRISRVDIENAADEFAATVINGGVFTDIKAIIDAAHLAGERVIIATASHQFYVKAIADSLNITDIVATGSVWRGDMLTPKILHENCYGTAKLAMLKSYFAAHDIDRDIVHVIFYSDHISDLPTFEWSDEPIVKNASPQLRSVAQTRGWRILD